MSSQTTSSQKHLRNLSRRCKNENCKRSVAKDGTFGLCTRCYTRSQKAKRKPKEFTEVERLCAPRDLELVLPERRPFEFTGLGIKADIARMNAEE